MVRVKICGITSLADALAAVIAGCDALGFVFYKKSSRYIAPQKARQIIRLLPKRVVKVGVFVDMAERKIKDIAKSCGLDILQFHGQETPAFCKKFKGYRLIKAFRVKDSIDLARVLQYKTFAYLFDSYVKASPGGTGKGFNWRLLKGLSAIKKPVFLSGGLNEKNVRRAIKMVEPQWVDASSSLEARPGKKDYCKVARFIREAKS
jgi:phosphoribosylanthranilate isomerase